MDSYVRARNMVYLTAARNDLPALNREINKIPKDRIKSILSEAMFDAIDKSINGADFQETVETLLNHGADLNYIHNGLTLLLSVLSKKRWPIAEWIANHKPNLTIHDSFNRSCLHILIENSGKDPWGIKLLTLLLSLGAEPNDVDAEGNTPLLKACEKLWIEAVQKLIQFKANIFCKNSTTFDSPLHVVAKMRGLQAIECAKELIAGGASVKQANKQQKTPLDDAITKGNAEMKEFLEQKLNEQEYMEQRNNMYYSYPQMQPLYDGMQSMYIQPYPGMYQNVNDALNYPYACIVLI